MRIRYCPVHMYNQDNPNKYRLGFFILADAKYYFVYYIDVYQGNNKANIYIHPSLHNLTTTHKYVANDIIKSEITNDPHEYIHIYMENRYADVQLF